MEFYAQTSDLSQELDLVQHVVERRFTIPVLSNVLLEFDKLELRLSATDLALGARCACPARAKAPGAVAVPARRLLDIVRSLPDAEARFKVVENDRLEVKCDRSVFKLVGMAKEKFPVLPEMPKPQARIAVGVLRALVERTIFAVSCDESHLSLTGALLVVKPERAVIAATDGHRLALAEHRGEVPGVSGDLRMLVPHQAMTELQRLLAASAQEAEVRIAGDDRHLFFAVGRRLLISRVLTGEFPNYEAVLPKENTKVVELDAELARAAVRRVALLADERSGAISVELGQNRVEFGCSGGQHGEARESLDARNGEALKIGFNYHYLLDFFGAAGKAGTVRLELKDGQSAAELRLSEDDSYGFRYVVMPLRVRGGA